MFPNRLTPQLPHGFAHAYVLDNTPMLGQRRQGESGEEKEHGEETCMFAVVRGGKERGEKKKDIQSTNAWLLQETHQGLVRGGKERGERKKDMSRENTCLKAWVKGGKERREGKIDFKRTRYLMQRTHAVPCIIPLQLNICLSAPHQGWVRGGK
jgi:hypothetical protein